MCCRLSPLQVQYVLSDKTGTLTQNVMGFVWASVGGVLYGQHASEDKRLAGMPASTPHSIALDDGVQKALCFRQDKSDKNRQPQPALLDFLTNLAVCNTVVPSVNPDGSLLYQVRQDLTQIHACCTPCVADGVVFVFSRSQFCKAAMGCLHVCSSPCA